MRTAKVAAVVAVPSCISSIAERLLRGIDGSQNGVRHGLFCGVEKGEAVWGRRRFCKPLIPEGQEFGASLELQMLEKGESRVTKFLRANQFAVTYFHTGDYTAILANSSTGMCHSRYTNNAANGWLIANCERSTVLFDLPRLFHSGRRETGPWEWINLLLELTGNLT